MNKMYIIKFITLPMIFLFCFTQIIGESSFRVIAQPSQIKERNSGSTTALMYPTQPLLKRLLEQLDNQQPPTDPKPNPAVSLLGELLIKAHECTMDAASIDAKKKQLVKVVFSMNPSLLSYKEMIEFLGILITTIWKEELQGNSFTILYINTTAQKIYGISPQTGTKWVLTGDGELEPLLLWKQNFGFSNSFGNNLFRDRQENPGWISLLIAAGLTVIEILALLFTSATNRLSADEQAATDPAGIQQPHKTREQHTGQSKMYELISGSIAALFIMGIMIPWSTFIMATWAFSGIAILTGLIWMCIKVHKLLTLLKSPFFPSFFPHPTSSYPVSGHIQHIPYIPPVREINTKEDTGNPPLQEKPALEKNVFTLADTEAESLAHRLYPLFETHKHPLCTEHSAIPGHRYASYADHQIHALKKALTALQSAGDLNKDFEAVCALISTDIRHMTALLHALQCILLAMNTSAAGKEMLSGKILYLLFSGSQELQKPEINSIALDYRETSLGEPLHPFITLWQEQWQESAA